MKLSSVTARSFLPVPADFSSVLSLFLRLCTLSNGLSRNDEKAAGFWHIVDLAARVDCWVDVVEWDGMAQCGAL